MSNVVNTYISDLKNEFKGYNFSSFQKDFMAGITVAAVALPLALAFGISSGADASAGLITAIISAFLIGSLSGASFQISGPTGAMSAILLPLSVKYGYEGVLVAGLMAGVILIFAGIFKLGKLVYFLPSPVIAGFTSGIAIIIAMGQIDNFLGISSDTEGIFGYLKYFITNGFHPNFFTLLIGVFTILFLLIWPKKWGQKVPASLIAIIIITAISIFFTLPVETVGNIPKTLIHANRISISGFSNIQLNNLALPAISIATLCMIESLLCGVSAGRMKGERLNGNRELFAQGIGNIILPFFGGVPATSAIARTSVAIKSGQVTRLTGIFHGAMLLLSMFLLSPFMSQIPLSVLAGILMVTAWRMNEWKNINYIFSHKFKGAAAKFLITMSVTVVFDLTIAIAAGVIFSMIYFVVKSSNLEVTVSEIDPKRFGSDMPIPKDSYVVYVTGPIFFGSLDYLTSSIEGIKGNVLILSMRGVPLIDTSGVQGVLEFCENKQKEGVSILFSSLQPNVKDSLDRAGVTAFLGEKAFFNTAKDAIESTQIQI